MCGIAGIISIRPLPQLDLFDFIGRLRHRGPDSWGYYLSSLSEAGQEDSDNSKGSQIHTGVEWKTGPGNLVKHDYQGYLSRPFMALLHARLSILDLSPLGNQPMFYNQGKLVLIFNGEIYNYLEIKASLKAKGYSFSTGSDSEVVLAAYQEWGEECVQHFNGMWAFAIYDTIKQQLFISRDRLGVKPLFYTYNAQNGFFSFASEIKALLALPGIKPEANREQCQSYLLLDCVENTSLTFFNNIFRLPPAYNMIINLSRIENRMSSGQFYSINKYWDIKINNQRADRKLKDIENKKEEFFELFTDAVRIRLRSDVPVGTALSGGLDSSSNVYVINNLLKQNQAGGIGKKQYSFSSVYLRPEEKYVDESQYIDLVVGKLGIKSIKTVPEVDRLSKEVMNLVYHQDEPFGSTSIFAQWCVFSLPRPNGVLVTLDGQGADEQLAGYLTYLGNYWSELSVFDARLYSEIWRSRDLNESLKRKLLNLLASKTQKIGLSSLIDNAILKWRKRQTSSLFAGYEVERILEFSLETRPERFKLGDLSLNEKLAFDTQHNLAILLRYADRNSMAYGVESRGPYLDYRLVEYLADLPSGYKIHDGWTKYIARKAFNGKMPNEITWRRDKLGFPTPEKAWLTGPLRDWGTSMLKSADFLADLGVLPQVINSYDSLANDFSLWRLINMECWAQVFNVQ